MLLYYFWKKELLVEKLIPFTVHDLAKVTNHRSGEVKFGEKMLTVPRQENPIQYLTQCSAHFVLIGISEDVGVRANNGRPGTASAWESAISAIANIQHNRFGKGDMILVLGQIDVSEQMEAARGLRFSDSVERRKLCSLVESIDREVAHIVSVVVKAGKIPIVIGGGHNNAYGNIKGAALAKGKQINAVNFDAHSDFRILEGRHSGNGFSYAFEEGFLKKYFIFGLHENYTAKKVLKNLQKLVDRVRFNTYDEIAIRQEKSFDTALKEAVEFVTDDCFGLEIDLDAVPGIASSAMTLSGFSVELLRRFVTVFGSHHHAAYLHICEGAPVLGDEKNPQLVGKLIGYLVTDFMKARVPVETTEKYLAKQAAKAAAQNGKARQ